MLNSLLKLFVSQFSVYEETLQWLKKNSLPHYAEEEAPSTNDKAKSEAFSLSDPVKNYLVDQQTSGRGRGSNTWDNPKPGHSMMMSFSFAIKGTPQPISTPLAGLALAKTLENVFSVQNISLKAPNDILLNGKKMAGILVEVVQMGNEFRLIIGIGLNVYSAPKSQTDANFLDASALITKSKWQNFLSQLQTELKLVSQEALGTHLSEKQRQDILNYLNKNPNISDQYESLSPFGDLSQAGKVISWREL